jgi:hypothetical protein
MPKFVYTGDHSAVTLWRIDFPQGVAVAVEDPHALKKLRGNNHFAEVFDGVEVVPAAAPTPAVAIADDVTDVVAKPKRKYTRKQA